MASTLDAGGESPPVLRKGHGTAALGPSDSSDSGSDVTGGPGLDDSDELLVRTGSTSDPDGARHANAGADLGDADLDSDSDRAGTGERAAVGHDASVPVDTLLRDDDDRAVDGDDVSDDNAAGAAGDSAQPRDDAAARPAR